MARVLKYAPRAKRARKTGFLCLCGAAILASKARGWFCPACEVTK